MSHSQRRAPFTTLLCPSYCVLLHHQGHWGQLTQATPNRLLWSAHWWLNPIWQIYSEIVFSDGCGRLETSVGMCALICLITQPWETLLMKWLKDKPLFDSWCAALHLPAGWVVWTLQNKVALQSSDYSALHHKQSRVMFSMGHFKPFQLF